MGNKKRPNYSDQEKTELIKRICGLVIQSSVKQACKQVGLDDSTFYAWLASDEEFSSEYMRARKAISYKNETEIEEIADTVRNGEIDPAAARVYVDTKKWLAGKRNAPIYGDKASIEHTGKDGGEIATKVVYSWQGDEEES